MICFMRDNDGHDYAIPVDRRDYFTSLLEISEEHDEYTAFNAEFEDKRLPCHISSYCFENLRKVDDPDAI